MKRSIFFIYDGEYDQARIDRLKKISLRDKDGEEFCLEWVVLQNKNDSALRTWQNTSFEKNDDCAVLLIGENTAFVKGVRELAVGAWNAGIGLVAIEIGKIEDHRGWQVRRRDLAHPLAGLMDGCAKLVDEISTYRSPSPTSEETLLFFESHISDWVAQAVELRKRLIRVGSVSIVVAD